MELKPEEYEDNFRSWCADEEELDGDELVKQGLKNNIDNGFLD